MIDLGRACGLETEYGVNSASTSVSVSSSPAAQCLPPEEIVNHLFSATERAVRTPHGFLSNGGRLYVDIGSHPEYASPECFTVQDVVAQDSAGDEILAQMCMDANKRLSERNLKLHVLKTNQDSHGNTFGCHENYQVDADFVPGGNFFAFLSARQILTGGGFLTAGGEYLFSSRAEFLQAETSSDPTHARAFVNTRHEPLADEGRWNRLHVTCSDSEMSQGSTAVKVALMGWVLQLMHQDRWSFDITLVNPLDALKIWNRDPCLQVECEGACSRISGTDLMKRVLDSLEVLPQLSAVSHRAIFDLAYRGVMSLESGDYSAVETELDWAIKHRVLERVAERSPQGWCDVKVQRTQLAYHDVSPHSGLRSALLKAGLMRRFVAADFVEQSRSVAPSGSRAVLRGKVVEACAQTNRALSVGWTHVRLDDPPHPQIDLPDPQMTNLEQIDTLLYTIKKLGKKT